MIKVLKNLSHIWIDHIFPPKNRASKAFITNHPISILAKKKSGKRETVKSVKMLQLIFHKLLC